MRSWILLALILTSANPCLALDKVGGSLYKRAEFPKPPVVDSLTTADVAQIIPLDMQPTSDSSIVAAKIADRSVQYWYEHSGIKDTRFGHVVETAQETLKADVIVPAEKPDEISHRFSFRFEAFQGLAKLEYTGWLKAAVNYDTFKTQTDIFLRESFFEDKNLYLNHRISSQENSSSIGVSWNW